MHILIENFLEILIKNVFLALNLVFTIKIDQITVKMIETKFKSTKLTFAHSERYKNTFLCCGLGGSAYVLEYIVFS